MHGATLLKLIFIGGFNAGRICLSLTWSLIVRFSKIMFLFSKSAIGTCSS